MQLTSTWTDTLLFQNQFSQEGNCGFLTAMLTDCEAKRPIRSFESFNFLIYHSSFIYLCVQCLRLPRDHRAWDQHRLLWGSDPVAGSGESSCCPHPGDPVLLSSTSLNLTLTASPHPRLTPLPPLSPALNWRRRVSDNTQPVSTRTSVSFPPFYLFC